MREINLDKLFAEFEATAAPTFRPPGVAAARRRVHDRRRRRRGLLAGLVALILAGPGAYAVADRERDGDPPTPTPSPTPDGRPIERKVNPVGVAGRLDTLRFVDARHGWALFDTCAPTDDLGRTDCRRDLARTADGGETWQRTPLPDAVNRPLLSGPVHLLPVDGRTLTVRAGEGYLVTTDGGASFTEHPLGSPPEATRLGVASRSGYLLRCPDGNGVYDLPCSRYRLARVGAAATLTQPPLIMNGDAARQLVEGGDGRLWVTVQEGDRLSVVVSSDSASTWQKLPVVRGAARLLVSPDGQHLWLVGMGDTEYSVSTTKRVWQLVDDSWRERVELPPDTNSVAAINGGLLAVTSAYGNIGYWTGERYIDAPEPRKRFGNGEDSPSVQILPDDTIVITTPTTTILGPGTAQNRTWTRLLH
ncbi:hypothetical protein SAMN05443287_107194 [Micromonospora phaseoli]|uniref:Exo-alpha-sialidase n=1 Tax=Micromonospora phaseoli TaxID=1144548 RepID=A0A1H7BD12_9ACTN|nr:hypothetical protein [Micromonospora phaseoli]PZV95030.1 hypothetical protein CLV64_108168 [Micromonospora phaseoli]GIJ79545.1 hypothetical protein Xph01_39770 [Micromonospora phaseoli]SEJ75569.1 hypothetical protein SAMN05443287_107194 [Micromonospora phaseoli]